MPPVIASCHRPAAADPPWMKPTRGEVRLPLPLWEGDGGRGRTGALFLVRSAATKQSPPIEHLDGFFAALLRAIAGEAGDCSLRETAPGRDPRRGTARSLSPAISDYGEDVRPVHPDQRRLVTYEIRPAGAAPHCGIQMIGAYMQRPPHALGVKRGSFCEAQLRDRDTSPDDSVDLLIRRRCHDGRQLRLCPVESCLFCTLLWLLTTQKT
jgi:hypothetical protein